MAVAGLRSRRFRSLGKWATALHSQAALLACGYIALCLIFGGASRENALPRMILELLSLPLIWRALTELTRPGQAVPAPRLALILLGGMLVIPLLQVVPIPMSLWEQAPGRAEVATMLRTAGVDAAPLGVSLAPELTFRSWLALLPPTAVFLTVLMLDDAGRMKVGSTVVALAVVSAILGVLQVAGGSGSALRFYATTNLTEAVGFFANRNHQAVLSAAALVLCSPWLATLLSGRQVDRRAFFTLAATVFTGALLVIGAILPHSRAGLAFVLVALLAIPVIAFRRNRFGLKPLLFAAGLLLPVCGLVYLASGPTLDRANQYIAGERMDEQRGALRPKIIELAKAFSPIGSGAGTFDTVYRAAEDLEDVTPTFLNHAHNDYLEIWVETGVLGWIALALFLGWYAVRAYSAWTAPPDDSRALRRAATVIIAILLAHSVVDYPLRTEALAALFAFACAALLPARGAPSAPSKRRRVRVRVPEDRGNEAA